MKYQICDLAHVNLPTHPHDLLFSHTTLLISCYCTHTHIPSPFSMPMVHKTSCCRKRKLNFFKGHPVQLKLIFKCFIQCITKKLGY